MGLSGVAVFKYNQIPESIVKEVPSPPMAASPLFKPLRFMGMTLKHR